MITYGIYLTTLPFKDCKSLDEFVGLMVWYIIDGGFLSINQNFDDSPFLDESDFFFIIQDDKIFILVF